VLPQIKEATNFLNQKGALLGTFNITAPLKRALMSMGRATSVLLLPPHRTHEAKRLIDLTLLISTTNSRVKTSTH